MRRRFATHQIQADKNGQYSIPDLLKATNGNGDGPKERSLESHSKLQSFKARQVELEIAEKEKVLINRDLAIEFLRSMAKATYRAIESFDVPVRDRDALAEAICERANEFMREHGWVLLTVAEIREHGARYPQYRRVDELWSRLLVEGTAKKIIDGNAES